ncbi:hypothetical protein QP585_24890, partial [Serratia ureilytica]|nr:hypothetical protein [Serratia ureilytica]
MAQRYNTGNPRPSNSMKDLNDNALAYDDFLNGEQDEAYDRFQKPFPTVRKQVAERVNEIIGAQQDAEKYAEEAKGYAEAAQKVSDIYTDELEAQKAVDDGKETRQFFWVRSQSETE